MKFRFIKELNNECTDILKQNSDNSLIDMEFDLKQRESTFNHKFIGLPGALVFDTIVPDNIEFCDLLLYDPTNVHLLHLKKGFDNSIRDLATQVRISARRLQEDLKSGFHYIEHVEDRVRKAARSKSDISKRLGGQIFPKGGLKGIFQNRKDKNIVFCLAFVDTASSNRELKKEVAKFSSNIAKYSLIELKRDILAMGFDFKVIQLKKCNKLSSHS